MRTSDAPAPVGPYSQAVATESSVYVAGQLGIDPATGAMALGGVTAQARQALTNVAAILEEAGSSMADVAKTTVFLADFDDFAAVNEVYSTFFEGVFPARSAFEVVRLPLGGLVEIEAIAVRR
ncbi:MAG: Rid family detoxifying hydrolase [Acidimicrobiaceae bacterium]|nr:Rid family detoxifying hydrolase [Acidimicrobiaceae bacterium]